MLDDKILDKVEKRTNVKKETIVNLAKKLSEGNMSDENTLKDVINTLSKATGKPVSEDMTNNIIKTIKEDKVPKNVDKMF